MFQPIVLSTVKNFHAYFDTVNDRDYSSPDIASNIIEFCLKKQREREKELLAIVSPFLSNARAFSRLYHFSDCKA